MSDTSTRDAILREARRFFANQGFEGTSLNEIADAVGIRRPSLMHHFSSKEAIYHQVLLDALTQWGHNVEQARSEHLGGWELVDAVLATTFDFFRENPDVIAIFRREALNQNGPLGFNLGVALRPYFTRAVNFFEREMNAGRFRRHDPENLVVTGYGALLTYFSDHWMLAGLIEKDPFSDEALEARFDHVRSFVRAALEPQAPMS